jgi:ketosteroid isomerase-like protein
MAGMKEATSAGKQPEGDDSYTGEDFTVHQYGDVAICNFRLVRKGTDDGKPVTQSYRNTGTFQKRNGKWQVVAWQATKIEEKH